jgi:membrane dipeptidase
VLREREDPVRRGISQHADSLERRKGIDDKHYTVTVTLPEMRKGHVGIMLSTIMARVMAPSVASHNSVRTQGTAYARGQSHLHYYNALAREGEITFIKNSADLDACVESWQNPTPETPVGLILTAESSDPILGPDQVQEWWDAGLRSVSLTHFGANTYGHGSGTLGGLYPPAYPLLDALKDVGMILDLTHAADLTFWQILDYWDGPVHASHCNCRALTPGQRHLSDEMIKAITDRDGVLGMVFAEQMLSPTWSWDDPTTHYTTATRPMKSVVEHIDHICQLTGNADHVAFGTDLDGGYGKELAPTDYNTIEDLQRFPSILEENGYNAEDIDKICHGNLIRLFKNNWS